MAKRPVKPNQIAEGPFPGWQESVWPIDHGRQEFGSNQSRAVFSRPGGPPQGKLTGRVILESNNTNSPVTPAVEGGPETPSESHVKDIAHKPWR
jgi:hypothetical protein